MRITQRNKYNVIYNLISQDFYSVTCNIQYLFCSGFVRGPPNTVPELVTFQQNFKKGALLTVVSLFAFEINVYKGNVLVLRVERSKSLFWRSG